MKGRVIFSFLIEMYYNFKKKILSKILDGPQTICQFCFQKILFIFCVVSPNDWNEMFAFLSLSFSRKSAQWLSPRATVSQVWRSHCLGTITPTPPPPQKETATKQQSSQTLFGPIFLMFQQGLICGQKCLVPLTAKVTESTTHGADSKQGIWGMAFKQWLSLKPFCLPMLRNLAMPQLPPCCHSTFIENASLSHCLVLCWLEAFC